MFALLLAARLVAAFPTAALSAPDAEDPLAGRLGGTLASFEERYGAPRSGTPEQGAEFAVPGYGVVFVQFKLPPDPTRPNRVSLQATPDSPAMVIALSSPRPASLAATAPDVADWSLAEAQDRVRRFLPTDAAVGALVTEGTTATAPCRSESLAGAFDGAPDACRIGFVLPTDDTVSYATLALAPTADGTGEGPANPCVGLVAWSRDAGARMDEGRELLDQLGAIAAADPDAPAALRDLGQGFSRLATAQRAAPVPPVAVVANDLLVDAFAAYADAFADAADGVAAGEPARVDAAVRAIGEADAAVERATAAIRRALGGCGLTPGTPVPG
jgi:hypothetical protein